MIFSPLQFALHFTYEPVSSPPALMKDTQPSSFTVLSFIAARGFLQLTVVITALPHPAPFISHVSAISITNECEPVERFIAWGLFLFQERAQPTP